MARFIQGKLYHFSYGERWRYLFILCSFRNDTFYSRQYMCQYSNPEDPLELVKHSESQTALVGLDDDALSNLRDATPEEVYFFHRIFHTRQVMERMPKQIDHYEIV